MAQTQIIVEPLYHFVGDGWEKRPRRKTLAMDVFHLLYNEWVELVNGNFEKWNAEFDELYPGTDMSEDDSEGRRIYNDFIAKKERPFADQVNRALPMPMFKAGVSSEEANFILIGRWNDKDYVSCGYRIVE